MVTFENRVVRIFFHDRLIPNGRDGYMDRLRGRQQLEHWDQLERRGPSQCRGSWDISFNASLG
jgi:hypothetical protein